MAAAVNEPMRRGRRSSVTQDELVAAALALGPDDLNLRDVADMLNVPRTTIYNHVRSTEALGKRVLLHLLQSAETPPLRDAAAGWQDQLEDFALRSLDLLTRPGRWLRFFNTDMHMRLNVFREADQLIAMLMDAGFSVEDAGRALHLLSSLVNEAVRLLGRDPAASLEFIAQLRAAGSRRISAASVVHQPGREMEQFRFNLRCALTGLTARLA